MDPKIVLLILRGYRLLTYLGASATSGDHLRLVGWRIDNTCRMLRYHHSFGWAEMGIVCEDNGTIVGYEEVSWDKLRGMALHTLDLDQGFFTGGDHGP